MRHSELLVFLLQNLIISNAVPMFGENVELVEENEFPFIVSLSWKKRLIQREGAHECNGALITPRHVLTAEHCLIDANLSLLKIISGSTDLRSSNTRVFIPESVFTYKKWTEARNVRAPRCVDIAILKLTEDVTHLDPVNFSHLSDDEMIGTKVTLAGWGTIDDVGKPRRMRKVSLEVMRNKDCENRMEKLINKIFRLYDIFMCLEADPWAVAQKGDSGAPILDENKDMVGLTVGTCPISIPNLQDKVTMGLRTNHLAEFISDVITGNEV